MLAEYLEYNINLISEVHISEQIQITAAIEASFNDNFNCQKCLTKHDGNPEKESILDKERKLKACFDVVEYERFNSGVFSFKKCPGSFVNKWIYDLFDMFLLYSKFGKMPYNGGIADQPARVIQFFNMIDSIKTSREEQEKKKEGSTQKRVAQKLSRRRGANGQ